MVVPVFLTGEIIRPEHRPGLIWVKRNKSVYAPKWGKYPRDI
jgi:hypothetical protein